MKRNYQYLLSGGNLPQQKLPKLDDQAIEKLYKYYSSKDKFHAKFKGTKREYCASVANLLENFLKKQRISKNLVGGAPKKLTKKEKAADAVESKKEDEKYLEEVRNLEERIKELTGSEKKKAEAELKYITSKKYIEKYVKLNEGQVFTKKINKEKNKYSYGEFVTRGVQSRHLTPSSVLEEHEDEDDYPDLTYEELIRHAEKYEEVVSLYIGDDAATANFLLTARFTHLTDFSPEGRQERKDFASIAKTFGIGAGSWGDSEEASYATEYLDFKLVQSKKVGFLGWSETKTRFFCISKILSEKAKYTPVDFESENTVDELKGNMTASESGKVCQVDTKKVVEVIFNSFKTGELDRLRTAPKSSSISFIKYTNNEKMAKLDVDIDGNLRGSRLFVEGIIEWDLTAMISTPTGKKVMNELKPFMIQYNNSEFPKDATAICKSVIPNDKIFGLIMSHLKAEKPQDVGKFKTGSSGQTTLNLPLFNKNFTNDCKLVAYAGNLGIENPNPRLEPTVDDFYEAVNPDKPGNLRKLERFKTYGTKEIISTVKEGDDKEPIHYEYGDGPSGVVMINDKTKETQDNNSVFIKLYEKLMSASDKKEDLETIKDSKGNLYAKPETVIGYITSFLRKFPITSTEGLDKKQKISEIVKEYSDRLTEPLGDVTVIADDPSTHGVATSVVEQVKTRTPEEEAEAEAERLRKAAETSAALTSMTDDELSQKYFPDLDDVGSIRKALKELLGVPSSSKIRDPVLFEMLRKNPPKD